jgi:hypothetical protein
MLLSHDPNVSEINSVQDGATTLQVGPDRVIINEGEVIIDALHAMPDWQIREFCRIPIRFQNQRFYLAKREPGEKPYAARYRLAPWGDSGLTRSAELFYDEQSVAERENDLKTDQHDAATRVILLLFYPFLGLLWSKTKEKLVRFGFVPRTITGISIMAAFCILLLDGIFVKMLMVRSLRSGELTIGGLIRAFYGEDYMDFGAFRVRVLWLDCVLLACLIFDVIIRYSQHLGEAEAPWGFMEWITVPFKPRKKSAKV